MRTRHFTLHRYQQNVSVNEAKGLKWPSIRGTLLPCIDAQCDGGIAINWLWLRLRLVKGVL